MPSGCIQNYYDHFVYLFVSFLVLSNKFKLYATFKSSTSYNLIQKNKTILYICSKYLGLSLELFHTFWKAYHFSLQDYSVYLKKKRKAYNITDFQIGVWIFSIINEIGFNESKDASRSSLEDVKM